MNQEDQPGAPPIVPKLRPTRARRAPAGLSELALEASTDQSLMQAHRAGDPHAFSELVRRHRSKLTAVAWQILRQPHDAEDAVQQAMLRAFRHADGLRGDSVYVWLRAITTNVSITMATARSRLTSRLAPEDLAVEAAGTDGEEASSRAELDHILRAALLGLPEDFRTAFVLRTMLDLSTEQVATWQDVSPGTVGSRVSRARKLLLDQIGVRQVVAILRGETELETGMGDEDAAAAR